MSAEFFIVGLMDRVTLAMLGGFTLGLQVVLILTLLRAADCLNGRIVAVAQIVFPIVLGVLVLSIFLASDADIAMIYRVLQHRAGGM